jgi:origin recognition complex subunit 4
MVWDEYRSIQGRRGAIGFCKQAAAAAWQALPLSGLAHYVDTNVESRGRDLSYAGTTHTCGAWGPPSSPEPRLGWVAHMLGCPSTTSLNPARRPAGVALLLGAADLEKGIREHPHCPDAVMQFHKQEI